MERQAHKRGKHSWKQIWYFLRISVKCYCYLESVIDTRIHEDKCENDLSSAGGEPGNDTEAASWRWPGGVADCKWTGLPTIVMVVIIMMVLFSSHGNILSKTMNNLIFDWPLDQGSSNGKKKKYLGKIKYRVDYDFITSTLTVTVIECKVGSKIKIQQNTKADTTLNITKYTRTLPQWTWMDFQTLTSASIFFLTTKRNLRQKSIGRPWTQSSMKPSNSQ